MSQEFLSSKIFGIKWSRLLLSCSQTLYMVGWALLIGTVIGMVLALTTGTIGLLGAPAMAGYVGGGVGDLALTYGKSRCFVAESAALQRDFQSEKRRVP